MSFECAREAGTSTRSSDIEDPLNLVRIEPVLRFPHAICRWELDVAMPAERSREIAVGFCGALLQHLGDAVDEIVDEGRLAVFALPKIPVAASGEVAAVGLLVPRNPSERSSRALSTAIRSIGQEGFDVAGRDLRLRPTSSKAYELSRWVGPSRIWTSVTPWVSGVAGVKNLRTHILDSLGSSLFGDLDQAQRILAIERLVTRVQAHDEAWVPGLPPASRSFGARPAPSAHVRISFCSPVEGPIVIGRDRLLGMGLLAPVDPPVEPFE